jgi:hypothetical protein
MAGQVSWFLIVNQMFSHATLQRFLMTRQLLQI